MNTQYDLYSDAVKANPYPTYAALRAEQPVSRQPAAEGDYTIWHVTRYAEAETVLRDHKRFVKNFRNTRTPEELAQMPPLTRLGELLDGHMLNKDGEDHQRLRNLVNKAFTARMVNSMQQRVQRIADELLDRVAARGQMDLIDDYAFPLPIVVIAEMLGAPAKDRSRFRAWSDAFVVPARSEEEWRTHETLLHEFVNYLGALFAERRRVPQADLITALLQAEEAGDQLSEEELYAMVVLLIVAGHETTVNLIGNGTLALLRNPEQLAYLRAHPEKMADAVEELLRYDGPVERATLRFAAYDTELAGQQIKRGEPVAVVLGSVNRDGSQFTHPETLDLTRTNNRHMAFGYGVHYCVGAPLARMEGRIALNALLQRLPDLRLATPVEAIQWRYNPILRGMHHLPVAWGNDG
ncbi:MAG TPA: cytochrome P450 [Caldilineaceae bacterium]|nr:cytochrome P450 [Caldilineaceae bacterium]